MIEYALGGINPMDKIMCKLKIVFVILAIFGVLWHILYYQKMSLKSKIFSLENKQKCGEIDPENDEFFVSDVDFEKCYFGEKIINWDNFMTNINLKLNESEYLQFTSKNLFNKRYDRPYLNTYKYLGKDIDGNVNIELSPKDDWIVLSKFFGRFDKDIDEFLNWMHSVEFTNDGYELDYVTTMIQTNKGNCNAFSNAVIGYLKYLVLKYDISLQAKYKVFYVENDYALYHIYPIVYFNEKTYSLDFTDDYYKQDINLFLNKLKEELNNE